MYILKNRIKFIKMIMIFAIIIMSMKVVFEFIIEKKVVDNRINYEMYDNCYNIKNNYYCEKIK